MKHLKKYNENTIIPNDKVYIVMEGTADSPPYESIVVVKSSLESAVEFCGMEYDPDLEDDEYLQSNSAQELGWDKDYIIVEKEIQD